MDKSHEFTEEEEADMEVANITAAKGMYKQKEEDEEFPIQD